MTDSDLIIEELVDDHVLVLTMNRFERRNAFDDAMSKAMEAALDRFDADPDLWIAVLTGAGGVFSAGMDLVAAAQGDTCITEGRGGFGIITMPPDKPIIAAIEGYALAGGLEIALSCDLIVAADSARLGLPEVRWSLIPSGGGLLRLPRRIPFHIAAEMILTAEPRTAAQMHQWGLVNRLCDPGQARDSALVLAGEILRNGPVGLAASVQVLRTAPQMTDEQGWVFQEPFVERILASRDRREGLAAFAEKRTPRWTGS